MFQNIRNKIESKLEAMSSIQEVQAYPTMDFGGFPAAMVTSTRNDAEFETTTQNKRMYVFTVFLLQEIKTKGVEQARKIIESVVDDVITDFDEDEDLTGISLGSNETLITSMPTLSNIYEEENGRYIVGEMEIRIVVSVSVT